MTAIRNRVISALALCCLIVVTGCSATYRNHGYAPPEEDLQNLVVGVDTRATVDDVVGPPSLSGVLADGDYYYVRSRVREYGMFLFCSYSHSTMQIQNRQQRLAALRDTIANIEEFGLEDGQVVPIARRVTDTSVVSNGFIRQLLSNIGNINPASAFE